ncbi:unnamed protein product [Alternaria alternata]
MLRTPLHERRTGTTITKWWSTCSKSLGFSYMCPDKDLSTPLHLALLMGYESIARQLLEGSGFGETTNEKGSVFSDRSLLEAGYNVDTRDNLGRSALHIATLLGYFEIARGPRILWSEVLTAKTGEATQHYALAIQRKRCDFIDMLLESSADITGVRTDEWLDAYGRKLPDAVHLEEKSSGKKTIRFIEAAADSRYNQADAQRTKDRASSHRISQLEERGSNRELILRLAQNARTWADLRKILKEQTRTAHEFASDYSFRYNGNQGSDEVDMLLSDFTTTIGGRLDGLDQTVRDLLQLEFAWVSIHDVHRSISIATSTKRLSWITFIFLPAMFTSSLFGMNVNILKDNPDWRWFFLAGSICLVSTICAWLIFKYCPIESWIEREVGQKIRRVANVSVQVASERKGSKEPKRLPV